MDLTAITTLISSVGFPIAACCVMFKIYYDTNATLQSIAIAMQELVNKIDDIQKDVEKVKGE